MVIKTSIPSDSVLINAWVKLDYEDSFKIEVRPRIMVTSDDLIRSFLVSSPTWVISLMKIIDKIVKLIGLKTNSGSELEHAMALLKKTYDVGEKFGLFELFSKNNKEAILGADDSHLDFRISIYLDSQVKGNKQFLYISTIVKINNRMGWIYFNTIDIFHKLVVKSFLKKMGRHLNSNF